jgi:hypothetical protein
MFIGDIRYLPGSSRSIKNEEPNVFKAGFASLKLRWSISYGQKAYLFSGSERVVRLFTA